MLICFKKQYLLKIKYYQLILTLKSYLSLSLVYLFLIISHRSMNNECWQQQLNFLLLKSFLYFISISLSCNCILQTNLKYSFYVKVVDFRLHFHLSLMRIFDLDNHYYLRCFKERMETGFAFSLIGPKENFSTMDATLFQLFHPMYQVYSQAYAESSLFK